MRTGSAARGVVLTKTQSPPSSGCSQGLNLPRQRRPDGQGDRPPSHVIPVILHQDQGLFIFLHFVLPGHVVLREAAPARLPPPPSWPVCT